MPIAPSAAPLMRLAVPTSLPFVLALAAVCAPRAFAVGSQVVPKSDGSPDGLYYTLDDAGSDASRFITEYLAHDFDPGDLIVGARVADYGSGATSMGKLVAELRFEDPLHPGFPDLSPDGLVGSAVAGLEDPCGTDATFRREIAFGAVEAPAARTIYLVIGLPRSSSSIPCGLQLDTSSKPTGASKAYLSSTDDYVSIRANHMAEIRAQRTSPQDLDFRVHGSARFVGDEGRAIVYARRDNPAGRPSDDFITLDLVVDNREPQPVSLSVEVWADPGEILPGHLPIELTSGFRGLGSGGRLDGLRTFPRGRTVINTVLRRTLPRWSLGMLPAGLDFTASLLDPLVQSVPRDREVARVGLRPAPGVQDDASTEQVLLVSTPARPGDALAVRYPLVDLPRVPFALWGVEVVGVETSDLSRRGYDAIEVRREDPILTGGPDPSAEGLLASVGVMDGVAEVDMTKSLAARRFLVRPFEIDPLEPAYPNLWAQVVLSPLDTFPAGTVVGADLNAATLLGDSYFSNEGTTPLVPDIARNYQIRILVGEWSEPFQSDPPQGTDPLASPPGGFTVAGGPQPISVVTVMSGGHGGNRD